jgi:hypothetical protein
MTTAAMVSHNGTFTGFGTPDLSTRILRGHALDVLTALNHPENSATYVSFTVPLRHISQNPDGTSFPTIRNICKLLARFSISLRFGHPPLAIPHAATRSTRAKSISAIKKTLQFRALNNNQHRQLTSKAPLLPRSFGPANQKPSSDTIRDVVNFGSIRYMGTIFWTLSPYIMAHCTFSGLSRNSQGSAVLVGSSKMFGTVYNLTTRASRVTASLSNRGHHLASSAQEIITAVQPICEANGLMTGTATASDITPGMSAQHPPQPPVTSTTTPYKP